MEIILQLGSTAIGLKTKEGVVLAVEKRITSPLLVCIWIFVDTSYSFLNGVSSVEGGDDLKFCSRNPAVWRKLWKLMST